MHALQVLPRVVADDPNGGKECKRDGPAKLAHTLLESAFGLHDQPSCAEQTVGDRPS
jgi:hypothetical protein